MNDLTPSDLISILMDTAGGEVGKALFVVIVVLLVLTIPNWIKEHLDKLEKEPYGPKRSSEEYQSKLELWRVLYGLSLFLFRFLPAVFAWGLLKAMGN